MRIVVKCIANDSTLHLKKKKTHKKTDSFIGHEQVDHKLFIYQQKKAVTFFFNLLRDTNECKENAGQKQGSYFCELEVKVLLSQQEQEHSALILRLFFTTQSINKGGAPPFVLSSYKYIYTDLQVLLFSSQSNVGTVVSHSDR